MAKRPPVSGVRPAKRPIAPSGVRSAKRRIGGQVSKTAARGADPGGQKRRPGTAKRLFADLTPKPRPDPGAGGDGPPVSELIPEKPRLETVRDAAKDCRACDLYKRGTQTVFGEGPRKAEVMLVGEQPGDAEDLAGHPFVGPAGKLLDRALDEAGIDRKLVYVTNVVKHFKWEPRGKRRIHAKPNGSEIAACRPWLETEIALVKPRILVCLGATAAQALLGKSFKVTKQRGTFVPSPLAPRVTATVHPSSILRAPDEESRHDEMRRFVADLERVAAALSQE
jgi:uracil-DNA glycosylase